MFLFIKKWKSNVWDSTNLYVIPSGGSVCVVLSEGNTNENEGPVVFNLERKLGTNGTICVTYEIIDETTEPADILGNRTGKVTFVDGQTMATVEVVINDDDVKT